MNSPKSKNKRLSAGFSLVEVAMAMGIVAFVMISLIGLLPAGLTTFKQATTNTIEAQIVQQITNDLLLDNYSVLQGYATGTPPTYYYDNEGTQVPTGQSYVYAANLQLTPVSAANSPADLSGVAVATAVAYNVVINITNASDKSRYTLDHPHKYPIIIADNGLRSTN